MYGDTLLLVFHVESKPAKLANLLSHNQSSFGLCRLQGLRSPHPWQVGRNKPSPSDEDDLWRPCCRLAS
jgi:hypothetical protein